MMQIQLNPFPAVYFNVYCKEHICPVSIRIEPNKFFQKEEILGGQITPLRCEKGGAPSETNCTSSWGIAINGPGDILITS